MFRKVLTIVAAGFVYCIGLQTAKAQDFWSPGVNTYYDVWRNSSDDLSTANIIGSWLGATSYTDPDVVAGQDYYYWVKGRTTETVLGSNSWCVFGGDYTLSMDLSMTCPTSAKKDASSFLRGEVILTITPGSSSSGTLETAFKEDDVNLPDTMASWMQTGQLVSYEHPIHYNYSANVVMSDYEPLNSIAEVYLSSYYNATGAATPIVEVQLQDNYDPAPSSISAVGDRNGIQVNWSSSTGNTGFTNSVGAALSPVTDRTVAYYPFNGNADDESGHGHHGTVYGAALAQGRFGNPNSAYRFNGSSDYIEIPDSSDFDLTESWAISVSLKIETHGGAVIGKYKSMHDDEGGWSAYVASNEIQFTIYRENYNNFDFIISESIPLDTWVDIKWEYNQSTNVLSVYRDGQLLDYASPTFAIQPCPWDVLIGAGRSPSGDAEVFFGGVIDEVIIVPEPATLSLLALGGLTVLRKRRRR